MAIILYISMETEANVLEIINVLELIPMAVANVTTVCRMPQVGSGVDYIAGMPKIGMG